MSIGAGVMIVLIVASTSSSGSKASTAVAPTATQDPLVSWAGKYGSVINPLATDLQKLGKDNGTVSNTGDFSIIQADCPQLGIDTATAAADPPIPKVSLEQHWSALPSDLRSTSQDCVPGAESNDTGS